jgi:molybdenum cofactor guanylyltransferase
MPPSVDPGKVKGFKGAAISGRERLLRVPGMLMIGAAGKNAGKTEFACSLIRRLSKNIKITGVKITSVSEKEGACPRGIHKCGACESFDGNFCITEEDGKEPYKDTARMLGAGAARVWWLRVLKDHLEEGARVLVKNIGRDSMIVCESNSMRKAVEPDLFIVARDGNSDECKPSCAEVIHYADGIALSDGKMFDPAPSIFGLSNGHWTFKRKASAIVLAGGKSTRMGRDKAMLPVEGVPMMQRIIEQLKPSFSEIIISASGAGICAEPGCRLVPDRVEGQGPLMAIASALSSSSNDINMVVPCDMPDLPQHLIATLLRQAANVDGVVPVTEDGKYEPLFAVYRKSMLAGAEKALARGERRVISMYEGMNVIGIPVDDEKELKNLNTMADYIARCGNPPV